MRQTRFSGRQITVMVVATCAAVILAPVAVAASTGNLVNITDPVNAAAKARVASTGSLATAPRDPYTGSWGRVDGGALRVGGTVHTVAGGGTQAVTGTVTAVPGPPSGPFEFSMDVDGGFTSTLLVGPSATQINLTALAVSPTPANSTATSNLFLFAIQQPVGATTCSGEGAPGTFTVTIYHVPNVQASPAFVTSFPTPLVARPATGRKICLYANTSSTATTINGSGYVGG